MLQVFNFSGHSTIEFFDIEKLGIRLYTYDTRYRAPGAMTTSASDDRTLVYVGGGCTVAAVDCQTLAFRTSVSFFPYLVKCLVCVGEGSEELVIAVRRGELFAYGMQSGKLMWRIHGKVPGLGTEICSGGAVSDGRANIFVLEDNMKVVHKFSMDGKYVSTVIKQGENGIGAVHQMAWNKSDSSLLVLHKLTDKYSITAVKV